MTEVIVVSSLVLLSILGIIWPKVSVAFLGDSTPRNPDSFQIRMDLINDLLEACEGCDAETKAVATAGDVIAKHWRYEHE